MVYSDAVVTRGSITPPEITNCGATEKNSGPEGKTDCTAKESYRRRADTEDTVVVKRTVYARLVPVSMLVRVLKN